MERTLQKLSIGTLSLALGLALIGCNQSEQMAPTADDASSEPRLGPKDAAFSMEASAIKSREKEPAKIEAALRDLRSRLGYPALPRELSSSHADPNEAPLALGKAAATEWTQMRSANIGYHFAHTRVITVRPNATLKVWAEQVNGGADPMVMGFYSNGGSVNDQSFQTLFVGYNDDMAAGNVNAYFKWKNLGTVSRSIRLVSWCYPGTAGVTTTSWSLTETGRPTATGAKTMWVSGWTDFYPSDASDYAGCTGPSRSRINLFKDGGSPTAGTGNTFVAFNEATLRGGYLRDTDDAILLLEDVLPRGGSSFVLGYFAGDGYQPSDMDADNALDLLDAHYGGPYYHGSQDDRYSCP
jgi:hypothetical protein